MVKLKSMSLPASATLYIILCQYLWIAIVVRAVAIEKHDKNKNTNIENEDILNSQNHHLKTEKTENQRHKTAADIVDVNRNHSRNHKSVQHNTSMHRTQENSKAKDSFKLSDESRLIKFLQKRYKRSGTLSRPVRNSSETITIDFGIALIQILDFDETNQVLTTNIWKRYRWKDELLMWDPNDFGGIKDIRVHTRDIWIPDIVLYNNADDQVEKHDEMIAVYQTGWVRWIPPAIYKSSCSIDMRNFPFDAQTCHFKFGSWMYDGDKLSLSFYAELEDIDLRNYINSSEFSVISTKAEHNVKYYPCCGEEPFPDITYYLTIQRRPAFHIYILILPSILLSFLTLVLFWIPPQRPDRTSLGMSLFSSFFVLLLILVQSAPPTSASISLLGVYYCINMVLVAFSTMLSAVVINLTHYLQRRNIPRPVKLIFVDLLGRLLCAQCADSVASASNDREIDAEYSNNLLIPENGGGEYNSHLHHTTSNNCTANNTNGGSRSGNGLKTITTHHGGRRKRDKTQTVRSQEWKILAAVIDRIFFILYLTGITLSIIFVFPRS